MEEGMNVSMHVSNWLMNYALNAGMSGYVIGVSGGIDSATVSTLCALTGLKTIVVTMPIHQAKDQQDRGFAHCDWLRNKYPKVECIHAPLTKTYDEFVYNAPSVVMASDLALANSKARLRMTTLYAIAQATGTLVAGTGNKVEDFGLGFYTKWGDGAVDVSPIGELTKSEVWALGRELGVNQEIIDATPTDGLHDDGRTDEMQIGATYHELEWAMLMYDSKEFKQHGYDMLNDEEKKIMKIYQTFHEKNQHKNKLPPVCPHL
jgi:NAD+ synthase